MGRKGRCGGLPRRQRLCPGPKYPDLVVRAGQCGAGLLGVASAMPSQPASLQVPLIAIHVTGQGRPAGTASAISRRRPQAAGARAQLADGRPPRGPWRHLAAAPADPHRLAARARLPSVVYFTRACAGQACCRDHQSGKSWGPRMAQPGDESRPSRLAATGGAGPSPKQSYPGTVHRR